MKTLKPKVVLVVAMLTVETALLRLLTNLNSEEITHLKQLRSIYCSLEFHLRLTINHKVVLVIIVVL